MLGMTVSRPSMDIGYGGLCLKNVRCFGRLAQWESASFTPKRSGVRNPDRPPRYRRSKALSMILDRAFPVQHPQKSHTLFPDCLVKSRGDRVEVVREEVAVGVQREDRSRRDRASSARP